MTTTAPIPRSRRLGLAIVLALLTACVATGAIVAGWASRPSSAVEPGNAALAAPAAPDSPPLAMGGGLAATDGVLPYHTSIADDRYPGIAGIDAGLRQALDEATDEASAAGIDLWVVSGWRSAAYQERLLQDAVAQYGSEQEAARWVATAETSLHVAGDAVDIGATDAVAWLAAHGGRFGLCQVYLNEPWHFELRPKAVTGGCPPPYADPTEDPRLQG